MTTTVTTDSYCYTTQKKLLKKTTECGTVRKKKAIKIVPIPGKGNDRFILFEMSYPILTQTRFTAAEDLPLAIMPSVPVKKEEEEEEVRIIRISSRLIVSHMTFRF